MVINFAMSVGKNGNQCTTATTMKMGGWSRSLSLGNCNVTSEQMDVVLSVVVVVTVTVANAVASKIAVDKLVQQSSNCLFDYFS